MRCLILILFLFMSHTPGFCQGAGKLERRDSREGRINFFISSRTKKLDFAMKSAQFQAKILSKMQKNFYAIIVDSVSDMCDQINTILDKRKAKIGSIWFDSHGHFSRRYASFEVGVSEFSFQTILDGTSGKELLPIVKYCDAQTRVGIGSCYGGASFTLPAIDDFGAQRMNGDSLIRGLSKILNGAIVYGSESFVMSPPGMFFSRYGLAGIPAKKKYADPIYQPGWQMLGKWNSYDREKDIIKMVGTVKIDGKGNIHCEEVEYLTIGRNRKKLEKKLKQLQKGNFDLGFFYQALNEKNTGANE